MLVIILTIAITAIAIALYIVIYNKYPYSSLEDTLSTIAAVLIVILFIEISAVALRPIKYRATKAQYAVIAAQMEQSRKEGIVTDAVLLKEAIDMNKTIETHKSFRADPWLNWYFSNDIANLKPLQL